MGGTGGSAMDFETIYRQFPETYEALVAHEDYQANLAGALRGLIPGDGEYVVDIGTGTGHVARLLAGATHTASRPPIDRCRCCAPPPRLLRAGLPGWPPTTASSPCGPVGPIWWWPAGVSGIPWHGTGMTGPGRSIAPWERCVRIARPGGTLAVIETLGTGRETPLAPTQELANYYLWLEDEHGFERRWMRTDYLFEDAAQAERLIRFFFGDEMGDAVKTAGLRMVPECTGMWSRSVDTGI